VYSMGIADPVCIIAEGGYTTLLERLPQDVGLAVFCASGVIVNI